MHTLNVVLLNEKAVLPKKSRPDDAGFDIVGTEKLYDPNTNTITFKTGIAIEIPKGYAGFLMPRSSIYKTGLQLCNSIGLLDENFRGEIMFKFNMIAPGAETYQPGDRVGQLVILPLPKFEINLVNSLSKTDRGSNGFGSSGK